MTLAPIPLTTDGSGPYGSIPVAIFGPAGSVDSVVQALIEAGFGDPGQVLATNASQDGFEWVDLPE